MTDNIEEIIENPLWKADERINVTGTRPVRNVQGEIVCWVPAQTKYYHLIVNSYELLELLEWYVANDATEPTTDNQFWLEIRDRAMKVCRLARGKKKQ